MEHRLIAAILSAPLIAAMTWSLTLHLIGWYFSPYDAPFAWSSAFSIGMFAAFIGICATATLGMSAHSVLARWRMTGWAHYFIAGAMSGALICVLSGTTLGWGPLAFHLIPVSIGTAFLFWLIRRPDRDAPANPPTPAP